MLLSEVGFFKLSLVVGQRVVALAVVHPAEGGSKDDGDEASHVLLDVLASAGRLATVFSGSEELERGLGLADGEGELRLGVGFVDPTAGAVVGGLGALGFAGEVAQGADAQAVGSRPGAELVLEVGLGDVVGAEVLDAGLRCRCRCIEDRCCRS